MRLEMKIIDFLIKRPDEEFTINALTKELGESYSFMNRKINEMAKDEIIFKKNVGKAILCSLNMKNDKTKAFLHMAEVDKRDDFFAKNKEIHLIVGDFLEKIKSISKNNLKFVLIFGSWAKGNGGKDSDIDIFMVTIKKINTIDAVKEITAQYGVEINPIQLLVDDFCSQRDKDIIKSIILNHIILSGFESFIELVWSV